MPDLLPTLEAPPHELVEAIPLRQVMHEAECATRQTNIIYYEPCDLPCIAAA
jgi:hypothetical protein